MKRMKKATKEPTILVTHDQAIDGLKKCIEKLEMLQQKGGMNVRKMRDIARRRRTAKAKLRQLEPTIRRRFKKRRLPTIAEYEAKLREALRVRDDA